MTLTEVYQSLCNILIYILIFFLYRLSHLNITNIYINEISLYIYVFHIINKYTLYIIIYIIFYYFSTNINVIRINREIII